MNVSDLLHYSLFADDLNLLKIGKCKTSLIMSMNTELSKIARWIKCNKLCLNDTKLSAIIFCRSNSQNMYLPIKLDNYCVPETNKVKFLGIILDKELKWNFHINKVVSDVCKMSGIIYHIRSKLNINAFMSIYYSLIYSKMIYCVTIWGGARDKFINPVSVAQNRVLRSILGLRRYDSVRQAYVDLKLLRFSNIYKLFSGLLIYKFMSSHYCTDTFRKVNTVHNRITRTSVNNIYVITPKIGSVE